MNTTTIITLVLIGLIFLTIAGSAIGTAAKDCADHAAARHAEIVSQLYGN